MSLKPLVGTLNASGRGQRSLLPADPCAPKELYLGTALLTLIGKRSGKGSQNLPTRHCDRTGNRTCQVIPFGSRKIQNILIIATWNLRTLLDVSHGTARPQRRTALIASELKCYNVDVAALSETRFLREGSLNKVEEGCKFFWKGYPLGGQHLQDKEKDVFYQALGLYTQLNFKEIWHAIKTLKKQLNPRA